jgi:hypothetical protein
MPAEVMIGASPIAPSARPGNPLTRIPRSCAARFQPFIRSASASGYRFRFRPLIR